MSRVKVSVVLEEGLFKKMNALLPQRKRSDFISRAIEQELRRLRQQKLRSAYLEAYGESESVCAELDGVTADGID